MTPTILLVEDEETDVFLLKNAFAQVGLTNPVHVARHGGEALDYVHGRGRFSDRSVFPLPYLILLDLKLPHTMGLEVLRQIRQQPNFRSIIILILTSSEDSRDIDTAYALGANGYLIKPADVMKLNALAQSIKDFWLGQNRPAPAFADLFSR